MTATADLARLSLNQITLGATGVDETVRYASEAGLGYVGLWRDKVAEIGTAAARRRCSDAGVEVSSLCRGGFFTGYLPPGNAFGAGGDPLDENLRAIEETAELGSGVLVLVCGGAGKGDIADARKRIADGIAAIVPHAAACGVRLGIEPLHPMYCAERSAVVTLTQALELAELHDPTHVGVIIDAYHVWWDPFLEQSIERAEGRIAGFHVCDWLVPTVDMVTGRGVMGDGSIPLRRLRAAVERAGYDGPIEVEVMNTDLWAEPVPDIVGRISDAYATHVA